MHLIELHQGLQVEAIPQHLAAVEGFMPLSQIVIKKTDDLVRFLGNPQTSKDKNSSIPYPKDEHPPLLLFRSLQSALPLAAQSQSQTHRCHKDKETEPINE